MTHEAETSRVAEVTPVAETAQLIKRRSNDVVWLGSDKVQIGYSFKMSDGQPSHQKTTVLDFSNVSREQLIELLCGTGLVVRLQRLLRLCSSAEIAAHPSTLATVVVLKDIIGATKTRSLVPPNPEVSIKQLCDTFNIGENELRSFLHANSKLLQTDNSSDKDVTVS